VDPTLSYRVTFDNSGQSVVVSGLALRNEGLVLRLARALTSELLLIERAD